MRAINLLTALFLSTSLHLNSVVAQTPDGPLVPFKEKLPPCAATCGKLWDVQGACAPVAPATDASKTCFCNSADLVPFTVGGPAGDCCAAVPADLQKIKDWYAEFCKDFKQTAPGTGTTSTGTGTSTTATGTATSTAKPAVKDDRTWMQSHYQWVIMAVILIVAIVGGWIAACIFRKRYLRKRELNFELRPPHQPWVGTVDNTSPYGGNGGDYAGGFGKEEAVLGKKKKRWVVHERT